MDLNRPEAIAMVNNTYAINTTDTRDKPPIPAIETISELKFLLKNCYPQRLG